MARFSLAVHWLGFLSLGSLIAAARLGGRQAWKDCGNKGGWDRGIPGCNPRPFPRTRETPQAAIALTTAATPYSGKG